MSRTYRRKTDGIYSSETMSVRRIQKRAREHAIWILEKYIDPRYHSIRFTDIWDIRDTILKMTSVNYCKRETRSRKRKWIAGRQWREECTRRRRVEGKAFIHKALYYPDFNEI